VTSDYRPRVVHRQPRLGDVQREKPDDPNDPLSKENRDLDRKDQEHLPRLPRGHPQI